MQIVKPAALPRDAHLAILSPASTPNPDKVAQGIAALQSLGYRTTLYPHALTKGPLYYAGTIEQRLTDLHAAFSEPTIDAILCTRGGWGSAELLPHLDLDLIRRHPKPFLGYSDHTSLHTWLNAAIGLVTFYAPMVAADFARVDGYDQASWMHALTGSSAWSLNAHDGLRVLRPGCATGRLAGGCLSIYTESLGTAYAPRTTSGSTILFLEDIGTKPYQWDRYLLHLRFAGLLTNCRGIVFGDMRQNLPTEDAQAANLLEQAILHSLRDFEGPIAIGLRCGHVSAPNITLPLGVQVRLDLAREADPQLLFLEHATETSSTCLTAT